MKENKYYICPEVNCPRLKYSACERMVAHEHDTNIEAEEEQEYKDVCGCPDCVPCDEHGEPIMLGLTKEEGIKYGEHIRSLLKPLNIPNNNKKLNLLKRLDILVICMLLILLGIFLYNFL